MNAGQFNADSGAINRGVLGKRCRTYSDNVPLTFVIKSRLPIDCSTMGSWRRVAGRFDCSYRGHHPSLSRQGLGSEEYAEDVQILVLREG